MPLVTIPIRSEIDLLHAREAGRKLAAELGFSSSEQTLIATAISEVTRNIIQYAGQGELIVSRAEPRTRPGIVIVAKDQGPGIPDIGLAMQDGFSTGGGLGMGLPGSKRLMDEFSLQSTVGLGTTVTMVKWVP